MMRGVCFREDRKENEERFNDGERGRNFGKNDRDFYHDCSN